MRKFGSSGKVDGKKKTVDRGKAEGTRGLRLVLRVAQRGNLMLRSLVDGEPSRVMAYDGTTGFVKEVVLLN